MYSSVTLQTMFSITKTFLVGWVARGGGGVNIFQDIFKEEAQDFRMLWEENLMGIKYMKIYTKISLGKSFMYKTLRKVCQKYNTW